VKHSDLEALLIEYLGLMRVFPPSSEISMLARHVELVLDANQRVNLTRIIDPASAARLHTADSLSVLDDVGKAPKGALLDLGSGAGFPGIPLAICTTRDVVLLDSVSKKVRELDLMVSALGLEDRVAATAGRAEALARSRPGTFSVIVARAVSELPALLELASPLLASDGRLVCMKGSPSREEVGRADAVAPLLGMRVEYQRAFDLPQEAGHRTVLCYRKVAAPRVALPRREGLAQHSPLG
jgi:16S rRNA (guanine527-N7)-methyltransferase